MDERLYWLAFSAFPGVGPVKFSALLRQFGSAKTAWRMTKFDLVKVIGEKTAEKFDRFKREFSIEEYTQKLKKEEVAFWTLEDEEYPKLLKEIKNPPFVLYVKGARVALGGPVATLYHTPVKQANSASGLRSRSSLSFGSERAALLENSPFASPAAGSPRLIAVVGTRKITNYGREVTRMLVRELVHAGFTIVSGLAFGIDACAHETAIESGGSTIAVLGCGVDCCYPSANQSLYERIVTGPGLVISEFPIGQKPTKGSFPSRNRIIAGLSLGVLVTEGAEDSGSLITADYAFRFQRKVFAVPGPITSGLSKGPHKLLSKGAKLVTSSEDIIQELGFQGKELKPPSLRLRRAKGDTKEEERILEILENEDLHIDEIVRRSGLSTSEVGSLLSIMEVKGMVRNVGVGVFGISYS